jgi:hypothetical protein
MESLTMNLRPFTPAIALLACGFLFLGASRKPSQVSSFDSIRRAGELHVEVLSCNGQTCTLKAGNEVRRVISPEQLAPGTGIARISNQAGTLSVSTFVRDKIPAASLGIVERVLYIENARIIYIEGADITYLSEDCQVGQMATSQGSDSAVCHKQK